MKRVSIGGQAVLEGVMMKGPDSYALSVRKPDGEIETTNTKYISFGERHKAVGKTPLVRGVVNFIESLYIGTKTLMDSSEYIEDEEEEPKKTKKKKDLANVTTEEKAVTASEKKEEKSQDKKEEKKEEGKGALILTLIVSLAFAICIFMLLPTFVSGFLYKVTSKDWIVNLAEGVLRLAIFLIYVWAISHMEDIKRTFMYHGAEHKSINCMERGLDLTVENVRSSTRFHKRCGTSFVFIVMIISIIVFMFVKTDVMWWRLVSRLLLIPVIAGISYEFIRYAGKHDNWFSNVLSAPGLWVQRLTTREPDDGMIEVAIASVESVIDSKEYVECVRNNSFEEC